MSGLTSDALTIGIPGVLCLSSGNQLLKLAGVSTCIVSSERFKHDINSLDTVSGLSTVMKLNPVSFIYNQDASSTQQVGFIAEEVNKIDPRLVAYDKNGLPFTVKYEQLTSVLAKAIQEQQVEIAALQLSSTNISTSTIGALIASSTWSLTLASTTAYTLASSTPFIERIATAVKSLIASTGDWVVQKISASLAVFNRVETQTLCVGQTCVSEDQLKALLDKNNVTAAGSAGLSTTSMQITNPNNQEPSTNNQIMTNNQDTITNTATSSTSNIETASTSSTSPPATISDPVVTDHIITTPEVPPVVEIVIPPVVVSPTETVAPEVIQ
jgi:hypothetical protein